MAEMGTDTTTEQVGTEETAAPGAEETATETATVEEAGETTGQEGEEKTPEQIEDEKRQAEIVKSKAGTEDGVQRRINKENARRKRAEEDVAYWRGKAEALESMKWSGKETTANAPGDISLIKPDPDKYETNAEFVAAMSEYSAKIAIAEYEASRTRRQQETETKKAQEVWNRNIDSMIAKGQDEFEDFDEVTDGRHLKLSPVMVQAIMETGALAHKVEYHLGKNPDLAQKIAGMTPLQQVKEIIKLEDTLKAASVKTTTKAPPPLETIQKGAVVDEDGRVLKMSTDERIRHNLAKKGIYVT